MLITHFDQKCKGHPPKCMSRFACGMVFKRLIAQISKKMFVQKAHTTRPSLRSAKEQEVSLALRTNNG